MDADTILEGGTEAFMEAQSVSRAGTSSTHLFIFSHIHTPKTEKQSELEPHMRVNIGSQLCTIGTFEGFGESVV